MLNLFTHESLSSHVNKLYFYYTSNFVKSHQLIMKIEHVLTKHEYKKLSHLIRRLRQSFLRHPFVINEFSHVISNTVREDDHTTAAFGQCLGKFTSGMHGRSTAAS